MRMLLVCAVLAAGCSRQAPALTPLHEYVLAMELLDREKEKLAEAETLDPSKPDNVDFLNKRKERFEFANELAKKAYNRLQESQKH